MIRAPPTDVLCALAAKQHACVDQAIAYASDSIVSRDESGPFITRRPFVSKAFPEHPWYPELLQQSGCTSEELCCDIDRSDRSVYVDLSWRLYRFPKRRPGLQPSFAK